MIYIVFLNMKFNIDWLNDLFFTSLCLENIESCYNLSTSFAYYKLMNIIFIFVGDINVR